MRRNRLMVGILAVLAGPAAAADLPSFGIERQHRFEVVRPAGGAPKRHVCDARHCEIATPRRERGSSCRGTDGLRQRREGRDGPRCFRSSQPSLAVLNCLTLCQVLVWGLRSANSEYPEFGTNSHTPSKTRLKRLKGSLESYLKITQKDLGFHSR